MYTKKSMYLGIAIMLVLMAVMVAGCTTSSPTASPTTAAATPTPAPSVTLTVFAAASLSDAFNETAANFEAAHPGVNVELNFAGTQQLKTQVDQGAYADVFAAASTSYMTGLKGEGLVNNSTIGNFTKNKLSVIVPKSNPANITSVADLSKSGIKLIVCAPSVPCGSYTQQLLNKSVNMSAYGPNYKKNVLANVVSQPTDVNSAVTPIALDQADAAFVYQSDVPASMKDKVTVIAIPDDLNVVAQYQIAVLKQSKNSDLASQFENYVLSADGQAILKKYGFIVA